MFKTKKKLTKTSFKSLKHIYTDFQNPTTHRTYIHTRIYTITLIFANDMNGFK